MPTTVTGAALIASTVDSTPIGSTSQSTGAFTSLTVSGGTTTSALTVNTSIIAGSLSVAGGVTTNALTVNTSIIAGSLSVAGGITTNALTVNTSITAGSLSVAGGSTLAALTVNTSIIAGSLSVAGGSTLAGLTVNTNTTTGSLTVTGAATVITPGSGDNSTTIINSAWAKVGFSVSLAANGFLKFPTWLGGLVIQWGAANSGASTQAISFPTAFPSAVWSIICQPINFGVNAGRATPYLDAVSTSGFTQTSSGSTNSIYWFAIGH